MKKLTAMIVSLLIMGNAAALPAAMTVSADTLPQEGITYAELQIGDFTYLKFPTHIEIARCTSDASEIIVPEQIDDLPVTIICEGAFQGLSNLTAVVLPQSVKEIGDYAFEGTSLKDVYWEGDAYAWGDVTLPKVEDPILYANHYHNYVSYASGEDYTPGFHNGMAYRKYSDHIEIYQLNYTLSEIEIPSQIEGLPVTIVNGFFDKNLVGGWYWQNHALTSITIPETVSKFGITGCQSLKMIILDEKNPYFSVVDNNLLFSKDMTTLCYYSPYRSAASYTVPDTVTTIGSGAFTGCEKLQEIILPDTLNTIERDAFIGCRSLKSLALPDSLTKLNDPFSHCYSLRYLEIPEGVTDLSDLQLFFCEELTTLILPDTLTSITDHAMGYGDPGLTDIYYAGTEEQWNEIVHMVPTGNHANPFENVNIHFDFQGFSPADLNGDTQINANDAAMLLTAAAELGADSESGLTDAQIEAADLNGDGSVDASDAAYILAYTASVGAGSEKSQIMNYVYENEKIVRRLSVCASNDTRWPGDNTIKVFEDRAALEDHLKQWDHYMGINTYSGLGTAYDVEEFLPLVCEPYNDEFFLNHNVIAIHFNESSSPSWHEVCGIDNNADGSISISILTHNKWGDPLEEQWIILVRVDKTITDAQMVNLMVTGENMQDSSLAD